LRQQLVALKRRRPESLDVLLAKAEKEKLSNLDFLDQLIGEQADARSERSVHRRIREADFAEDKSLEGFNWKFNPKAFDRQQIEELATGDFIRRRANLIMVGWSGVGRVTSFRPWAISLRPWISCPLSHLRKVDLRSDRFASRQNSS
jgi:DNA replication protein DnaC